MIHLDTSLVIAALSGEKRMAADLLARVLEGEKFAISTLVLFEWRRGPRTREELDAQEEFLPGALGVGFGSEEAQVAARLYRRVSRPRSREIDLAIAACAITHEAELWTLNPEDFSDVPGLQLVGRRRDDDAP